MNLNQAGEANIDGMILNQMELGLGVYTMSGSHNQDLWGHDQVETPNQDFASPRSHS